MKVSRKNQIAVPAEIRRRLGIGPGDTLILDVQGDHALLMREPEDWARGLIGLHAEVWEGIDPEAYVRDERDAWQG